MVRTSHCVDPDFALIAYNRFYLSSDRNFALPDNDLGFDLRCDLGGHMVWPL